MTLKPHERLVCVGQTALRAPDGTPLPAVPMYIIAEDNIIGENLNMAHAEDELQCDIAGILVGKFEQYIKGCEAAGLAIA